MSDPTENTNPSEAEKMGLSKSNFDRRVDPEMIDSLGAGGWLHPLLTRRQHDPSALDVQLRKTSDGNRSWLSVYPGLSSVLDVDLWHGVWRLRTHPTFQATTGFAQDWLDWQDAGTLAGQWAAIDQYLDVVLADDALLGPFIKKEGRVQNLMCAGASDAYRIIQREAVIAFVDQEAKSAAVGGIRQQILGDLAAAGATDNWWPGIANHGEPPKMGSEVDLVGIDPAGRLLVIEVKWAGAVGGITFAPAQVALYARLFSRLVTENADALDHLDGMLEQRTELGLTAGGGDLVRPARVVPVIAIGPGTMSPKALERLEAVHAALDVTRLDDAVEPLEVWILDNDGRIERRWLPGSEPLIATETQSAGPEPVTSFSTECRTAAIKWKHTTTTFPQWGRQPGTYRRVTGGPMHDFCFPIQLADLNLLPDARATALDRFRGAGIPWHHGVDGMPSNHLLSSQAQCANALAPLVDRPDALKQIFGSVLPIGEVLPFGAPAGAPHALDDYVVFEWIGLADHLGEWHGGHGTRGANNTSVDAAFRYRSPDGQIEIALVEWKYQEHYQHHELNGGEPRLAVRRQRYRPLWDDPSSTLRHDLIPYEDLFVEPFYQLMRQQMLAWKMEQTAEMDATAVRVVYVAPAANAQLAQSWNRPSQRLLEHPGITPPTTIWEAWKLMLHQPDRFIFLDSASLVTAASPMSEEWRSRYAHLAKAPGSGAVIPDLPPSLVITV